jgi:hypothetical protein
MTTVFGWLAGGFAALLLNYVAFLLAGPAYPVTPTTFGAFVVGAFAGMAVADRLGERGFRPLGIAAGLFLVVAVGLAGAVVMSHAAE